MDKEKQHISHSILMSYLSGEADALQIDKVDNWLSLSEDNAKYLKSLELLWLESGKLTPPPVAVDPKKAWKSISSEINFKSSFAFETENKKANYFKYILQAAAMIIVVFGAYGIFKIITGEFETKISASTDQIISDTLNDGSVINLNKHSTLSYPVKFDKSIRKVKLKGEAFFNVEHNENQAFVIELNGANIIVLGTSFNIKEIPEEHSVEVYVESGTVQLYAVNAESDTSSIILTEGEKGFVNTKSGIAEKPADEGMNANDMLWLNNTFVFDGVRLEYVADFLESYYDIEIEFAQDGVKNLLLTASFKNDNIEEIINVIASSFELEVKKDNQSFIFNEPEN